MVLKVPSKAVPLSLAVLVLCLGFDAVAHGAENERAALSLPSPWLTSTLLSTRGSTIDQGHLEITSRVFNSQEGGLRNNFWQFESATTSRKVEHQTNIKYGLTSRVDIQLVLQWEYNYSSAGASTGFGDLPVAIGFQALRDRQDSWIPDVRVWVQELFPTGRFENLDPSKPNLGAAGGGSFATTLGLAAQKVLHMGGDHFLRPRLNVFYGLETPVSVRGANAYGGGFGTDGRVHPGATVNVIVSAEYSLTRHWVLAFDLSYFHVNATHFSGTSGVTSTGAPAVMGKGAGDLLSLAPAVEYNFNEQLGFIVGPWFSVAARNTAHFVGVVAAANVFF